MDAIPGHLGSDRGIADSGEQPSSGTRVAGILGIIGGLVLISAWVPHVPWTWELFNLRLVLFTAGAMAVALAIHRRRDARFARASGIAAAAVIGANAWYLAMVILSIGRPVFPEPDPLFRQVFFFAATALWLSDAAFGLVSLRLGAVSRSAAAALMVGSILAFSGVDRLELVTGSLAALFIPLSQIGIALNGLAWIALGIGLLRSHYLPNGAASS